MINFWQQLMILKYLFRKYISKSVNGKCVKCIIVDRKNFYFIAMINNNNNNNKYFWRMVVARNYGIRKRIEERWFSTKCVLHDTLKNNMKKKKEKWCTPKYDLKK